MKRIFLAIILIIGLAAAYSFAQMGGENGGMMEQKHEMMQKGEHMMEHKGMMSHEDMMGNMMDMIDQMSAIMGNMSEMMEDMPKENVHNLSRMMKDVCSEMNKMSGMMDSGMATEKDMNAMHERINKMQKRMSDMMK